MSDRDAIQARRARLIALALAGVTTSACGPATCLRVAYDAGTDAAEQEDASDEEDGGEDG